MARPAGGAQVEAGDGVAAGDHAAIRPRRSGTSTTAWRAASASIRSRVEGLPISSSLVSSTVTGRLVAMPARSNWRIASMAM